MRRLDSVGTLLDQGIARAALDPGESAALEALRGAASRFFSRDEAWKRAHGDDAGLCGYRPYGMQWSDDPDQRDECASYAYWANQPALLPGRRDLLELTTALRGYWQAAASVSAAVLAALADHYRYPRALDFGPASYVEVNAYGTPAGRELLQGRHEDGHLFTLVHPNKPGLEVELDGVMTPWTARPGEVTIMAGSLLTAMTGGEAPPLFHRVVNHQLPGRVTVLFFVNAPFSGRVDPYVLNDGNRGDDMAALSRMKCTLFGKPPPPALA